VRGGHPHRFGTLPAEALVGEDPERRYAPWVQARQAQFESDLVRAWRNDPIAQVEVLGGDRASAYDPSLRMAAAYPRHEKDEAPN